MTTLFNYDMFFLFNFTITDWDNQKFDRQTWIFIFHVKETSVQFQSGLVIQLSDTELQHHLVRIASVALIFKNNLKFNMVFERVESVIINPDVNVAKS